MSELMEDFEFLEDWEEKYDYIINTLAKKVPFMSNEYKNDETKVDGCMSQVWIKVIKNPNNTYSFLGDSDSVIVKGLIYILLDVYNGKTSEEIKNIEVEQIFDKIGINAHLTLKRRNGLFAMIERIKKETYEN